jgi:hypothetical protein
LSAVSFWAYFNASLWSSHFLVVIFPAVPILPSRVHTSLSMRAISMNSFDVPFSK